MEKSKASIGLSVVIFCVAILAGYAIFGMMQKEDLATPGAATATTPTTTAPVADPKDEGRPRYDVVFMIDATGSMADEIEEVKEQVVSMSKELEAGVPSPRIRFGLVLYKDKDDDFLVKKTPLTYDAQTIRTLLQEIDVNGGGDNPEHVGAALHEMLDMQWDMSEDVRRIAYLVGDAPGHRDYQDGLDIDPAVEKARERGIKINAIGSNGIENEGGKIQFEKIAEATGGKFEAVTYHAVVQREDGTKHSVIYEGGEMYEADEVLEDKEWSKGAINLKRNKRVKKARPKTRSRASGAKKKNNTIEIIRGGF